MAKCKVADIIVDVLQSAGAKRCYGVVIRPSDAELDSIAAMLNEGSRVTVYAGAGCEGARSQVIRLCDTLKSPMVHISRAKDFVEPENPYNVGTTSAPHSMRFRADCAPERRGIFSTGASKSTTRCWKTGPTRSARAAAT